MKGTRIILSAVLGLVFAGCAHEPTVDIDAARHAMDQAQEAQAAQYAPQSWTAAQDAEAKLAAELDAQAKRWSPLRSYTVAQKLAVDARAAADHSQQEAAVGKEQAKTEASTLMAQAREEFARAQTAVTTAPRGKGTEADLVSLRSDSNGIDETLQDMQRAFDARDYLGAKTKAQAAIDAAKGIEREIDEAKSGRRKV